MNDLYGFIDYKFSELKKEILISRALYTKYESIKLNHNDIKYDLPLVSVVVLAYKLGEKYLRRSLESIINQTLKNIEIIIVNDCSPLEEDDKICLEYKSKDNRIKYIKHEKNLGAGEARITGIKASTGYSVSVVDGDDFLSLNMYEVAINEMISNNVDIVCWNYSVLNSNNNIFFSNSYHLDIPYSIFYGKDVINSFCNEPIITAGYLWNKLIKRELLVNIGFDDIVVNTKIYEDLNYSFKIFYNAKSVMFLPTILYFYSIRNNSVLNSKLFIDNHYTDLYTSFENLYSYINKSSNIELTKLFFANYIWLYNIAVDNGNNYLSLYSDIIFKLINNNIIDRAILLDLLNKSYYDKGSIIWLNKILNYNGN